MKDFKLYRRTQIAEMRPVTEWDIKAYQVDKEIHSIRDTEFKVSISDVDRQNGSPKIGDMIARNPKNHNDQWLVAKQYFEDNFEPMPYFINEELLEKAIDVWGFDAQCEMIIEECLELVLALQKLKRLRGDKKQKFDNVIDEIADVKIMITQAQMLFPKDLIDARVDYKMNRLKERLNENLT